MSEMSKVFSADLDIPEGLSHITKGYLDYAKEVVLERALPGIDGLKPAQRKILYTMKFIEKVKDMTKCANIAGATMKLHPHGDASIYATLVRMVDSAEIMNIPYINGKGAFGKVYSTNPPAAARYTECKLAPISEELFRDIEGVTMVPSYDNKLMEPTLLPVSYPSVLVNTTQGIAIGIASNIPSFNFNELNNAVIELIETGDIKKPLMPDFTTAGCYIKNEHELNKLMTTGKARFKLRGKWHIDGKTIVVDEIPYYTTVEDIKEDLREVQGISDVRDESDKKGLRLAIECSSKKMVPFVLTEALRNSSLQMTFTSNIAVVVDNKPKVIGIKELLSDWVEFRKGVLNKKLNLELTRVIESIESYEVLVALLTDEVKRKKFIDFLVEGEMKARDYLRELFPERESCFDWILGMSLKSISNSGAKIRHLESLRNTKVEIEGKLANISGVIVSELKELNKRYSFPRKTEIVEDDFMFEDVDKPTVVKVEPTPVVVLLNGKFIKKMRSNVMTESLDGAIKCMSNDVISYIDSRGRLLRVNLENIEFSGEAERGIYLPVYLGEEDNFDLVCHEIISDKKVGYLFSDGNACVVDYGEWCNMQRCTKVTNCGVSPKASLIMAELNLEKDYIVVITKKGKIGFFKSDFKRKHRTARTKVVNVKADDSILRAVSCDYADLMQLVKMPEHYIDRLSALTIGDRFNEEYFDELQ